MRLKVRCDRSISVITTYILKLSNSHIPTSRRQKGHVSCSPSSNIFCQHGTQIAWVQANSGLLGPSHGRTSSLPSVMQIGHVLAAGGAAALAGGAAGGTAAFCSGSGVAAAAAIARVVRRLADMRAQCSMRSAVPHLVAA